VDVGLLAVDHVVAAVGEDRRLLAAADSDRRQHGDERDHGANDPHAPNLPLVHNPAMQGYEGKVVVITGASEGIGAALAEEIAQRGGRVVLAARSADKLAAVAARIGGAAVAVPTDVTVRADVERLRDAALAKAGRIDVWVNNVGRG